MLFGLCYLNLSAIWEPEVLLKAQAQKECFLILLRVPRVELRWLGLPSRHFYLLSRLTGPGFYHQTFPPLVFNVITLKSCSVGLPKGL